MADAEGACSLAGEVPGEPTCVIFMAGREQSEKNLK